MKWNGEFWEGTTASTCGIRGGLTYEKIMEAKRQIDALGPPPNVKFDLFGHDLGDQAYELNMPDDLRLPGTEGRRFVVVPRAQLERWAYELRRYGADVRVEPRIREPECASGGA